MPSAHSRDQGTRECGHRWHADERAKATYDDATAILAETKEIQAHQLAQDKALSEIIDRLNAQSPGREVLSASRSPLA